MEIFVMEGGKSLRGEVQISGAKNAALTIMAAALLVDGETVLENVPDIEDVRILGMIMQELGAKVYRDEKGNLHLDTSCLKKNSASYDLVKKLRASNLLLGPLVSRLGEAEIAMPGGCNIGTRPMDLHLKGIEKMGGTCSLKHGLIHAKSRKLKGGHVYLDFPSVGATENIMMAAALAEGVTVIENAAKEPEIVDLASFLGTLGVKVRGAGTDVIKIEGVEKIQGGAVYAIIPDRIEAGTFMTAAAVNEGDLVIKNVIPKHLEAVTAKLQEMGAEVKAEEDVIHVKGRENYRAVDIKTLPYPGFPTDMQSQMMAVLTQAEGDSVITENIFENRLKLAGELNRMGAHIKVEGRVAIVPGKQKLSGAPVKASDLRAGAALIIAGLLAEGTTEIAGVEFIDRGYEKIEDKLRKVGAVIRREKRPNGKGR